MLAKNFNVIIQSEENTIDFLKENVLIKIDNPPCVYCGSPKKMFRYSQRTGKRSDRDIVYFLIFIHLDILYLF